MRPSSRRFAARSTIRCRRWVRIRVLHWTFPKVEIQASQEDDDVMKARILVVAGLATMMALSAGAFGEEASFQVQSGDTVKSVLERSAGQTVGLRVEGGDELRGKV